MPQRYEAEDYECGPDGARSAEGDVEISVEKGRRSCQFRKPKEGKRGAYRTTQRL